MKRSNAILAAATLALVLLPSCASQRLGRTRWFGTESYDDYDHTARAYTFDTLLGVRMLQDTSAWEPVADQFELGLIFQTPLLGDTRYDPSYLDVLRWDLGFRWAYDSSRSEDALGIETDVDATIYDLGVGMVLSPFTARSPFEPYLGGGVALLWVESDVEIDDNRTRDTDSLMAPYVRGGARLDIAPGKHIGVDVRWLMDGGSTVDGIGGEIGSLSVSVMFGASF